MIICYNIYENDIKTQNRQKKQQTEKTGNAERQKTNFPKEQVENADLSKSILNKIMTTYE